jgi:hypothetical protein
MCLLQSFLGTTPNIAPPSNLNNPVSIAYNFIVRGTPVLIQTVWDRSSGLRNGAQNPFDIEACMECLRMAR